VLGATEFEAVQGAGLVNLMKPLRLGKRRF